MPFQPELAKTYDLKSRGEQPTIDGTPIPWHIHEDGPRVACIEPGLPVHVLWVPVLIDAPLPEYAHDPPGSSIKEHSHD